MRYILLFAIAALLLVSCKGRELDPKVFDNCADYKDEILRAECCYNRDLDLCPLTTEESVWDGKGCSCSKAKMETPVPKKPRGCALLAESLREGCCREKLRCPKGQAPVFSDDECRCEILGPDEANCTKVSVAERDACCRRQIYCSMVEMGKYNESDGRCYCEEGPLANQCKALRCGEDEYISLNVASGECYCAKS